MINKNSVSIISHNSSMLKLIDNINRVADSDISILLIGETGVGKEIFADYIHNLSMRPSNCIVKVGLATLPAELMESELFGFEKGSFTNADHSKQGMFELADSGSLFLDDIDDTPLNVQAKLLRAIEAEEIRHIGGVKPISIDVRLICASKVDLKELINRGTFRQDLYYRINVVELRIPPLRERKDDLPLLVDHFIKHFTNNKKLSVSQKVMDVFIDYNWPGNVRELRNVIQRSALFAEDIIDIDDLPDRFKDNGNINNIIKECELCFSSGKMNLNELLKCLESKLLSEAIEKTNGNQSIAARNLGMKLSTFRDKIKKLDI